MSKKFRQFSLYILAGVTYLIIHEGVHLLQAFNHNIFRGLRFNGIGIEVMITEPLTIGGWRLACFSGLSSIATILIGYIIYLLTPLILSGKSRLLKGYLYYTALVFLLVDPLYIAVFSFVVGGDINGIALGLGIPYMLIRAVFAAVLVLNIVLVVKKLYPQYTNDASFKPR